MLLLVSLQRNTQSFISLNTIYFLWNVPINHNNITVWELQLYCVFISLIRIIKSCHPSLQRLIISITIITLI